MSVNLFRFNVVDPSGTISFTGPAHGLKVLAAACSKGPATIGDLFDLAQRYDPEWIADIRLGLSVFDEHNIGTLTESYAPHVLSTDDAQHRPFRVVDAVTRNRSNQPARLGLVVVNLDAQRIIQVQNSYGELPRKGRGRIRNGGKPTRSMYHYELPEAWSIVP